MRLVLCLGLLVVAYSAPWTAAQVEHRYYLPALMVGRQIAFASDRGGNFYQDLYLMEPDGTSIVRVPGPDSVMCPAWSPSGDRLAFATLLDQDIWITSSDGRVLEQLTSGPDHDFAPAWSADASYVVFASISVTGSSGLFAVLPGQTGLFPVITAPHSGFWDPDWSSDGKRLVFASSMDGTTDIYTASISINGGIIQLGLPNRLTQDASWDMSPKWSPNGDVILFSSQRFGDSDIFTMNSDGTDVRRLTVAPEADVYPNWSPDGSQIVFTSIRDGNAEIYIMNADGSNQTNLTQSPDRDVCASWRR